MSSERVGLLAAAAVMLATTTAAAEVPLEFHGYATQGFALSDHNNYFLNNTNRGSLRLTEVALNVQSQVTDQLRLVMQVATVMNDLNPGADVVLDFGFADYRFNDYLGVRAGRFRQLIALYSEAWDADIARLPIFMPSSVYDPNGRQSLLTSQGLQIYGNLDGQDAGSLDYTASIGTRQPFLARGADVDIHWNFNSRLTYNTPIEGFRFGGVIVVIDAVSTTKLSAARVDELVAAGTVPAGFDGNVDQNWSPLLRLSAFAELSRGNVTLAAEYTRARADYVTEAGLEDALATFHRRNDGFYVQGAYRFNEWFQAGGYASFAFANYQRREWSNPGTRTFDYAATLRFDLNSYLAFKTEVHRIFGTSTLVWDLNQAMRSNNGWLFAARISAAF